MNISEFIKKSPKTELHLHIEGTLEPDLMFSLAQKNNIKIPFKNINDVKEAYNFSNLESFLKIYYEGAKVLIKEQDFFDLTWAYVLKCKEDHKKSHRRVEKDRRGKKRRREVQKGMAKQCRGR